MPQPAPRRFLILSTVLFAALASGCGKTLNHTATEQLVLSDAVDRSISAIDFQALSGETVYLDTTYVKEIKNNTYVNADYIISSLRQQMVAHRCLLQEQREDADYIVEARVGTLGADTHEVTYGLPANNLLSAASQIMPAAPPIPTIPEISAAKRSDQMAAAKIAVFAYERESRQPVWQSGLSIAKSTAKDTWLLGAGPFQSGNVRKGTRFAGEKFRWPFFGKDPPEEPQPLIAYDKEVHFVPADPASSLATQPGPADTQPVSTEPGPGQPVTVQPRSAPQTAPGSTQPPAATTQPVSTQQQPATQQPAAGPPVTQSSPSGPAFGEPDAHQVVVQPGPRAAGNDDPARFEPPIRQADRTGGSPGAPTPQ